MIYSVIKKSAIPTTPSVICKTHFSQPITNLWLNGQTQFHLSETHPASQPSQPPFFIFFFDATSQVLRLGLPWRPPVLRWVEARCLRPRCAPAVRQRPRRRGHGELRHGEPLAPLRRGGKGVEVDPSSPGNSWLNMVYHLLIYVLNSDG